MDNDDIPVTAVPPSRAFHWLAMGWRDLTRTPWPSLLHGLVVTLGGILIIWLTLHQWHLLPGVISGFMILGPILATGLYALSRRLEEGGKPQLTDAFRAWCCGAGPLLLLGLLLVFAGTAWVLVSAVLFALFVDVAIDTPLQLLRYAVGQDDLVFLLWLILGGLGAALVFAATVVSAPLLLDRRVDFAKAVRTSIRAVGESPSAACLWAVLIMLATALSLATVMVGFVVLIPVLGHGTWHAYRDLVDAAHLPRRT